jgi:hypothetical protein
MFYCLRFDTSLFVASYDSQGYGGGILTSSTRDCLFLDSVSPWVGFGWNIQTSPSPRIPTWRSCLSCCVNNFYLSVATEIFLYALPRNRRDSICNAFLIQSYSFLWKRVPTIRRPAAAPSVLPRERAQRSPAQQVGRFQLSGVMSHY